MTRSSFASVPPRSAHPVARLRATLLCFTAVFAACSAKAAPTGFAGDDAGARQLVAALQKGDATFLPSLRPTAKDLETLFDPAVRDAVGSYVETMYTEIKPAAVGAKEGQSEVILTAATSDDFRNKTAQAGEFPGGYQEHGDKFLPGARWYRWQFVKPGETSGMAFDGLTYVHDHWIWVPKPWRAMR